MAPQENKVLSQEAPQGKEDKQKKETIFCKCIYLMIS